MARKILISSNHSKAMSGFGKHAKVLLSYLYKQKNEDGTRKWECVEFAQGVSADDSRLKGMPWKAIGANPITNDFLIGQPRNQDGQYDPNLPRMVAYGAARIEEVLKEEKPDIFLGIEDPWAFYVLRQFSNRPYTAYWDTEWWNKGNNIIQTPLDSLPLYGEITANAPKIPHLFVKSTFAQKELHRLGHTHAGFWPCLMEVEPYRVFSDEEKAATRSKYGIDNDTLLFGFVFRNQGRKKPLELISALKKFKANNEGVKAKILFVTNPFEGWNLKGAVKEMELDPKDVLCAHRCSHCKSTVLKEMDEPAVDCPKCGGTKTLTHIGVDNGIPEKDLVEVYNILNGYVQAANSGGWENPMAEAAFAGVYSATVNYSFGELFIDSGEVFPIEYALDREMGSNFLKAIPSSDSILNFFQEIHDNPEASKQKGLRFREWAVANIHPEKTLKTMEEYFDSLPVNEYNWEFRTEWPNINAEFVDVEDQDAFIKQTYYSFFGTEIDEENKNYKAIVDELVRGGTRERVYQQCQIIAKNELGKRGQLKFDPKDHFKDNGKKRILFEMAGNFGDSLMCVTVLTQLHKMYKEEEWDIYVSCHPQFKQIYDHLPWIAGFVPVLGVKNFEFWEGARGQEKIVDIWIAPNLDRNYIHNGQNLQGFHPFSESFA